MDIIQVTNYDRDRSGMETVMPTNDQDTLAQIRQAAMKRILFLPHALDQMNHPDRMITTRDIRAVIATGTIVEDYPKDVRGHSCLMLGQGGDRHPIHVVCAPKTDYLAIITAYRPDPEQWEADWRTRRER